jgi:hypothetical protein
MAEKEYIEKRALIEAWERELTDATDLRDAFDWALESVPAADVVEVVHGEWFLLDECSNEGVYCSVCTKKVYRTEYANQKLKSNYCPNCGAKMDGGKHGKIS